MRDATWINIHTLPVRSEPRPYVILCTSRSLLVISVLVCYSTGNTNVHCTLIQHDIKVIEIRTLEGYGVRWRHDGSEFRGFLEPQMKDGHSVGWRH